MMFNPKEQLSENDYFFYNEVCSLMDPENRIKAIKYCNAMDITPYFFMVGCDEVVALETDDSVIIGISGSDKDKEEWRGNFDFVRGVGDAIKKAPKNKKGFHYNYYLQARHLKRLVKKEMKKRGVNKPIIWVGHSRGAAIAVVAYILCNVEINTIPSMAVPFDPPRSFTRRGWRWFKRNRKHKTVIHRTTSFLSDLFVVGAVPPAILGWVHRQTTLLRLPNVRGEFNHTHIKEGLSLKFYGIE